MKDEFKIEELVASGEICSALLGGHIHDGLNALRNLKDDIHTAIPPKQRSSRGITWVLQRISRLFVEVCASDQEICRLADVLSRQLDNGDVLLGVPIFLKAEVGRKQPSAFLPFFEEMADSGHWVVREFAAAAFRKLVGSNKAIVHPWLKKMACAESPNLRRFASETLRPVVDNRWLNDEPEYSLGVLRLLFREAHPYPRTSVGNNLSDLSRRQPELVFSIVHDLVAMRDANSAWIAHRACRNLVKKDPIRVFDALGEDEYHYKDRHVYR